MIVAETVTFGGSSLDRAAELRTDPVKLENLAQMGTACGVVFWRGKPLVEVVTPAKHLQLVRMPLDHPILAECRETPTFLGLEAKDAGIWAYELSDWQPDDLDETAIAGFLDTSEQRHPAAKEGSYFAEIRSVMTLLDARDAEIAATARAVHSWHASHGFCAICGAKSLKAMAGWQRNCPACGGHHFPRTDPVVIMLITRGNDVLLGRSPGWPEGMYSLLAGFVEPGETLEAAVRREVFEESNVQVAEVKYLASQPWPFPSSLMIGCHGNAITKEIKVDPVEIEDAQWVSKERLATIFAGGDTEITPAREGAIAHFLLWNWLADRLD